MVQDSTRPVRLCPDGPEVSVMSGLPMLEKYGQSQNGTGMRAMVAPGKHYLAVVQN